MMPTGSECSEEIQDVMRQCCSSFSIIAMREAVQGDEIEYSYQVRLIDPSYQSELIAKPKEIAGIKNPSLLMHRTTVEL
jgi:hypothetical protein